MIRIDDSLISAVAAKAAVSSRKRMNHNFHQQAEDVLQRMLNALEPGTYIRPHKHEAPDKREAFVLITGKVLFIEFDHVGGIDDWFIMDRKQGNYGLEITPAKYHTLIALEPKSVLYEIKDGPYDVDNDKHFAPWSPEEGSTESAAYMEKLLKAVGIQLTRDSTITNAQILASGNIGQKG